MPFPDASVAHEDFMKGTSYYLDLSINYIPYM